MGLSQCLNLLNDEITATHLDPINLMKEKEAVFARLDSYERILVAPWVETQFELDFGDHPNVWRVPSFNFPGYHPDHCNLSEIGGPLRGNHSAIAFAAFRCGLDVKQTVALYRENIFAAMGYLDHWEAARAGFLARYTRAGFEMKQAFLEWSRCGPFAYIPAHPRIACLRDLAKAVLVRADMEIKKTNVVPYDVMANAVIYPVYPEIASCLGIRGDYFFKLPTEYRLIGLREFIEGEFAFYQDCAGLVPTTPYEATVARAMSVIEDAR